MPLPFAIPALLSGFKHWKLLGLGLILLALAVQTLRLDSAQERAKRFKAEAAQCEKARKEDRRIYEQAQLDAALRNREQVKRIETEQERVTNEVTRDLNSRLERLRRELRQATPAAPGSPGGPGAGPDGKPRPGTPEASRVCLAPDDLLRAAENEERHDQLISWIEKQLGVKR